MTDPLSRIRDIALLLPGVEEQGSRGEPTFFVAGAMFARLRGGTTLCLRADEPEIDLEAASDWSVIEDRIARSWELAAPAHLLEAGGR